MEKIENKMGTWPVGKLIVSMSIPAMFSMLIQSLYNIVDGIFVAQYSDAAFTAVNLAYPIQILMIAVMVGTGVGINSLISRLLGQKNQSAADSAATHGIILSIVGWLVFAIIGLTFSRTFFASFTQDKEVIELGITYMVIVTVFSFGSFIEITIEKSLQATGNMMIPMILQLIGAVTNIILDPIMIFGLLGCPEMGIRGAAIATVIGQILAMLVGVIILKVKSHLITISFRKFRFKWRTIRDIYAVGFPAIIMQAITALTTTVLNYILFGLSPAAGDVLGAYYKLQSFVFMPIFGLNQGVMPIIGYNYGAGNKKRMFRALKLGYMIAICIMAVGTLLFMFLPDKLLLMFNATDEMLTTGITAFRIISISFIPAAIDILSSTLFQGIGQGIKSMIISILRQVVVIIPVSFFLSKLIGAYGVWWAFPISEITSLSVCIIMVLKIHKKLNKIL